MRNIIIILLVTLCCANAEKCNSCVDEAQKSRDAFNLVMPAAAIGLGGALICVGINHALGTNKKFDDGWFFVLPFVFASYEFGNGIYHGSRVVIGIQHGL